MMKSALFFLPLAVGVSLAQMPSSFDASGSSAASRDGDVQNVGEQPNPRLFGMEIPVMDPSNDTVKYNGAKLDVGNNAVVRARFEKYLSQSPDDTEQARKYRDRINRLLDLSRKYSSNRSQVGSKVLVQVGRGLYDASEYPGDYNQSGALASAIVSALEAQRGNLDRNRENEALSREIDRLVRATNRFTNANQVGRSGGGGAGKAPVQTEKHDKNVYLIGYNTQKIAANEAVKAKNDASSQAALAAAKLNYQGTLVYLFAQRFYDQALIGARVYRQVFRDGDVALKLDKDSDASKMFVGVTGMPPSVSTVDSLASTARQDVERSMESVRRMLEQNRLAQATQHLIEAVAVGEFQQCVTTFPAESRQRISRFWDLRKKAFSSLNGRDYGTLMQVADEMKKMDADFDDSQLRAYCEGKMQQSDLCVFNAQTAFEKGDREEFNKQITQAGVIWPRNPKLKEGQERLASVARYEPVRDEFRTLYARKEFRTIYDEQAKFEVVATDAALKEQYKEAITTVSTIDAMLEQLKVAAERDKTMGPCVAYETMLDCRKEESYAKDSEFDKAFHEYRSLAHAFVQALRNGEDLEKREEFGSALAQYYKARNICPQSRLAQEGAERVHKVISHALY